MSKSINNLPELESTKLSKIRHLRTKSFLVFLGIPILSTYAIYYNTDYNIFFGGWSIIIGISFIVLVYKLAVALKKRSIFWAFLVLTFVPPFFLNLIPFIYLQFKAHQYIKKSSEGGTSIK